MTQKSNEKQSHASCQTDVSGSVVTEVRKRKLGEYEFHCSKCNTIHQMSSYAIAQRTMGHELIFTCTCGNKIHL